MDDNKVDIEIIQVYNPWKFLAREKMECAKSPQAQEFQEMFQRMNRYCQQQTDEGMACYRPSLGEICAALRREDALWHRVKIESVGSQSHGKQVCCYMIDRGLRLTVLVSRLMKLARCFQEVPPQVHRCCLWGVQPLTLEIIPTDTGLNVIDRPCSKWDPAATDYMQTMVDESTGCQAEIFHRDSQNIHYLKLYFTMRRGTVCFNQALVDEHYATEMDMSEADFRFERLTKSRTTSTSSDSSTSLTSNSTTQRSQSRLADMPDLIPYGHEFESHKHSLRHVNNTSASGVFHKKKECGMDKQAMSALDCSFPNMNKTESRMKDTTTKLQSDVFNPETNSSLKVKVCRLNDQQSDENSSQGSDRDSKIRPFNKQSSLLTSPMPQKESSDSSQGSDRDSKIQPFTHQTNSSSPPKLTQESSEAALQNFINIGQGSSFSLPKFGSLIPQACPPGSLQKKRHVSHLLTRADAVRMPPLTTDTDDPTSDFGRSPSTGAVSPLNGGSAFDCSVLTGDHQQKAYSTATMTPSRNSNKSSSPRDGCRLKNSRSHDMDRHLETEVQDVPIVPQKPKIPLLTRQDKPAPRPLFGVVVHGKSVPSAICDASEVPFKESVKEALEEMGIQSARSIQAFVWPAVLGSRHIVGICPPKKGKTMSYVPAVVSLLLDKTEYIELPPGKGPIVVVIVPSWRNARDVYEMVESFIGPDMSSLKIKSHILYAGGTEHSERNQICLLQGCDILISTPHSLIRMLDQDLTSLKRMCHVILDDADVLASRFPKEVETVMQRYMLYLKDRKVHKKCLNLPKQVVILSSCWTKGVEDFYKRYTKEAIIAISSRVEASVYGGVRQAVKLTRLEHRLTTFCNLLGSLSAMKHRVAVFTQDAAEAQQLYQAARSRSVYCLLVHEELPSDVIEETRTQWIHSSQSKQLMVMVCTDQCYQDLAITNATMVIHYGLPDSKTKFGNRLACMLDYFMDRTSSIKPEIEPVSQVILTNRCADRAQSLYEILQRCPAEYSPQLEQFITGYKTSIENSERKVLCPFLKSFGVCDVQNKCSHRHLMIPGQDLKTGDTTQSTLPTSGEVKIKIIYVENASRYYCHLLEHRSVPGDVRTDLRLEYQRLVMEMVTFFSKEGNHVPYIPSEDPFVDSICAYKDSDGIFHRAKVLETHKKSITASTKHHLWLVDAGHHETATTDQLLKLPKSLAQIPYQAVEAYLCCVKPIDDDVEWTMEANMFINHLVQGKELVGRIMLSVGLTIWLLPLVHQISLKSVGLTNDINVRQELLANNFAAANSDHMQNLFELFRGKTEISEKLMRQYFDYTLEMEMRQETLSETDKFHEVSIAAVIDPDLFYIHKWETFEQLEDLEARIDQVVKQQKEDTDLQQHKADMGLQLEEGSVCLALSVDKRWYRAQIVTGLISGKWLVFFLDYGDKEKVAKSNVRPLPRELAELPCQAIECQLAYIQPPGSKWEKSATNAICDLAYFVNEDKKKLFVKVVSRVDANYGIGQKLGVDLWNNDVSFSQEIVWRCKAKCTQENAAIKDLVGKPALKNQLFFNNWDKIPYLCANIYWSEAPSDAVEQAKELQDVLSCRDEGWDSDLLQRGTLLSAFRVIGYVQNCEAHGILVDSLVTCCLDSDSVADVAVSEDLLASLAACLEQASRPNIQYQAAKAVSELVNQEIILKSLSNNTYLVSVLAQFLSRPQTSSVELETLKCLCSVAAVLVQKAEESVCAELISSEMVEHIFSALRQTSEDVERAPWLEMLAAIATWDSCHSFLMRDAHVADIMKLLVQCSCDKCLCPLMSVCRRLVAGSRKHKVVLLENKLMIILKDLEAGGLSSTMLDICLQLKEDLILTLPQPESLAGIPAMPSSEVSKTVPPYVTWSQNCFRIVLRVQVRDAQVEDFSITDTSISYRSKSDGVSSQFDWELFGAVVPERCRVCVYASYSLVSLRKQITGKWDRLLKQKVKLPFLSPDFEHPYNSDEEEDVENDDNITRLTQKKNLLCQKEMWQVQKIKKEFESSDESSDELAWYSNSSDEDPAIDLVSTMASNAMFSSQM
ncbi:hypothetical protein BsWGS_16516 [Bradybaena similaris]